MKEIANMNEYDYRAAVAEVSRLLTELQTYDATKKHPLTAINEQVELAAKLRAANQRLQELSLPDRGPELFD